MPVSPKLAMRLALELRGLYEAATNELIRAIAVQVGRGAQDATWQDRKLEALTLLMHDVDRTIDDLRREVPGAVERALGYTYRRGGAVASVEAEAAGITGSFGFMPDEEALTRLLSEAMRPHEQVILGIRRSVNDAYDQALVAAATVLTGTGTRVDAARTALSFLADQGITGFTDRSGRKWDMASYAEMATRTSSGHAAIDRRMTRMPLPTIGTAWPPEDQRPIFQRLNEWQAWWSGDPDALRKAYAGGTHTPITGRSRGSRRSRQAVLLGRIGN